MLANILKGFIKDIRIDAKTFIKSYQMNNRFSTGHHKISVIECEREIEDREIKLEITLNVISSIINKKRGSIRV